MLVKEGAKVSIGTPICFEKNDSRIIFVSPVSGTLSKIIRGDRRKILEIVIEPDFSNKKISHKVENTDSLSPEKIKNFLLKTGSWPFIRQRPFNVLADPDIIPKAIHISAISSAPLGVDYDFILKNNKKDFQSGINILNTLVPGNVNLFIDKDFEGLFSKIKNANIFGVSGPHPSGNVSVQIQETNPINIGEKVWVISLKNCMFNLILWRIQLQKNHSCFRISVSNPLF